MCVCDRAALTHSPARCGSYVAAFSELQHNKLSRPSPIFYCLSKTAVSSFTRVPGAASQKKKKKSFATWRGERKTEGSGRFQRRPEVHWGGVGEGVVVVVERSTNRWARFKVVASTHQTLSTELNPICFQEQTPKLRLDCHIFRH